MDQLGAVDVLDEDVNPMDEIAFSSRPTLRFHGSIPAFLQQIKSLAEQETRMLLVAPNHGEVERLAGLLREYGQPYRLGSRAQAPGGEQAYDESSHLAGDFRTPVIVQSAISSGVSLPDSNLVLFGANDFSDEADVAARPIPRKSKSKTAAFVSDFRDLTVGDYVVHVEHGIARYMGLKEIEQDGIRVEFMVLEFAEQARLYVPLTRLDLIQKYRSTDAGPAPVLNRLGSQQWAKTKARVRKAMQDMADELLKLYAQRKAAQGHAFPPDNEFQREFEDAFDYNETEDQISAIADIKRDMESPLPMDRLLVGRRGLRQDRSSHARRLQGGAGWPPGGGADSDHGPQLPAFRDLQEPVQAIPHHRGNDLALPLSQRAEVDSGAGRSGQGRHPDRHPSPAVKGSALPEPGLAGGG